jgi:ComF family protein
MISKIVDFVFPFLCLGCHKVVYSQGLCAACWSKLNFITPPYCQLCGNPLPVDFLSLCSQCKLWVPLFNSHRALWRYGPISRKIIFGLKHGRQRYLASLLATYLLPLALPMSVHCVVPVPLHKKRLSKRGFNQSALIAQWICRFTGLPLLLHDLKRWTGAGFQGGLSFQKRQEQVWGVFQCDKEFSGESILLIDDVYTTGATLNSCVSALKEMGAGQVHALTIAKVVL